MKLVQKIFFGVFGVLCLFFGFCLLVIPGRFLGAIGWAPVDPLLTRVLGAALLGMAWMARRVMGRAEVHLIRSAIELFFFFTLFSSAGLLRHVLIAGYPFMVWVLTLVLLTFSVLFAVVWFVLSREIKRG